MSKNKNELASVLNDTQEFVSSLIVAADTFSKAMKMVPPIIGAVRTIFDIPDEPVAIEEKPKKAAPKKKEPEPAEETAETEAEAPTEEKTYTKVEVRQFLAGIAKTHRDEVKDLLNKYGADNLTHLDEKHYAAVMAEAEELADA